MVTVTLTTKSQMTLPKKVREELGVGPGDSIDIVKEQGRYILLPRTVPVEALAGILGRSPVGPMSLEDEDKVLSAALGEEDERIRAGR